MILYVLGQYVIAIIIGLIGLLYILLKALASTINHNK
jgi:hypothetical protein